MHLMTNQRASMVDDAFVDSVAEEADVDKRSVVRRIAGLKVEGKPGRRIDAVLAKRGVHTFPANGTTPSLSNSPPDAA